MSTVGRGQGCILMASLLCGAGDMCRLSRHFPGVRVERAHRALAGCTSRA